MDAIKAVAISPVAGQELPYQFPINIV